MKKEQLLGFILFMFAIGAKAQTADTITDIWWNDNDNGTEIFSAPQVLPSFPGGISELGKYLSEHLAYPEEAIEAGIEGRVFIGFWVMKDGSLDHFKVLQSLGYGCDEAALEVIKGMPKWSPAMNRDVPIDYRYTLPVNFKLGEKDDVGELITCVEVMPEFPGGVQSLTEFITANLSYPQEAKEAGIEGRVFVSFIVERDGSLSSIQLLRGIGYGCDEEAMAVVKKMPKWTPATQRGKPVRMEYQLPIIFKLENENKN